MTLDKHTNQLMKAEEPVTAATNSVGTRDSMGLIYRPWAAPAIKAKCKVQNAISAWWRKEMGSARGQQSGSAL